MVRSTGARIVWIAVAVGSLGCGAAQPAGAGGSTGGRSGPGGGAGQMSGASGGAAGRASGAGGIGGASGASASSGTGGSAEAAGGSSGATGGAATGGAATGGAGAAGSGGSGGGSGGSAGGASVVGQACADPSSWTAGNGDYQITVEAGQKGAAWNRFYEQGVACDHANTLLATAYGRNAQGALKKGHDQAGFHYVRFHGVLNDDIGVYSETNGAAVYTWTRFDQVYDAITAAGMRPVVEISFTPSQMGSANTILTTLWYDGKSPNISKPKDWTKWEAFMTAIVQHLESRYGATEVRNWYFEVWNEPSWMYAGGDAGYNELYGHTARGLAAGDSQIRVGGPAGSGGESTYLIPGLVSYANANGVKLDFVSFHNYSNDNGANADPASMLSYYDSLQTKIASSGFKGTVINDEFGSSYSPVTLLDTEVSASFIAKTIHLIGTASKAGPPAMYAWWAISDLYEEVNTGTNTAYRPGNFGLLLKGDPAVPVSFDVAKPAFNAFRLLHLMGDSVVPTSGGTAGDGVNAVATVSADGSAVQVLVYNHVSGGTASSSATNSVKLTVNNIPGTGPLTVRQYVLDRGHSNSYQQWVSLGSPAKPSQAQWTQLSAAAELCYHQASGSGTSWSVTYPQAVYGVSLFVLSR